MKTVLILDDDHNRHKHFNKILSDCWRFHVYTAKQAISDLKEHSEAFDLVCLDHDLGLSENLIGVSDPGDGLEVAIFIRDELEINKRPKRILIHSHNQPAAQRMKRVLENTSIPVTLLPFSYR